MDSPGVLLGGENNSVARFNKQEGMEMPDASVTFTDLFYTHPQNPALT